MRVGTSSDGRGHGTAVLRLPIGVARRGVQGGAESAVGALRRYQEGGRCGDGIRHHNAHTRGAQRLTSKAAINIVVAPSQWITAINVRGDVATREEP